MVSRSDELMDLAAYVKKLEDELKVEKGINAKITKKMGELDREAHVLRQQLLLAAGFKRVEEAPDADSDKAGDDKAVGAGVLRDSNPLTVE